MTSPPVGSAAHYVAALRQQKWVLLGTILLALVVAVGVSATQPTTYRAEARILVRPGPGETLNLETEAALAESSAVLAATSETLGKGFAENVVVRPIVGTSILVVTYTDRSAVAASEGANAVARALLDYRRRAIETALSTAEEAIRRKLDALEGRLDSLPKGREFQERREALSVQVGLLEQRLSDARPELSKELARSEIVDPAEPPLTPYSPDYVKALTVALALSIPFAVAAALIRNQRAREPVVSAASEEQKQDHR